MTGLFSHPRYGNDFSPYGTNGDDMEQTIHHKVNDLVIEKRAFINGSFVDSIDGDVIHKVSPVDGRDLSGLSSCTAKDIDIAVAAATRTYDSSVWRGLDPQEKKDILLKLAILMEKNREELALLDTLETGRSFKSLFLDSIPKAIQALRYFAECVDKYYDHAIPPRSSSFAAITREPLGIVGIITPWNDPLVVATWKFAPALLMGNSVVMKPAEQSSFSILRVAKLAQEAGVPDGVLNIVPGYGEIAGKALALHKDVAAIFFTGSSEIGKAILQYAGQSNMKKVGLECGGKSAFIVSRLCHSLEKAASVLAKNIFYNQGQICSAPSRAIIDKDIKDSFVALLKKESERYIPDDPFNVKTDVGYLVSKEQEIRVRQYIRMGLESGATMITPEKDETMNSGAGFVMPTILDGVSADALVAQEEIFGPVVVVIGYTNIREAISIANKSRFGLAGSIWTNDLDEAYQVSRGLRAGIVHINCYGDDDNAAPFGGVKESGLGKDKSIFAFDEYSSSKVIWSRFSEI
jgi:acyl-CoA reductase-like NAD-dependent aldehyde dehydrogenase